MPQPRYLGFEIKTLSNLLRRKMCLLSGESEGESVSDMERMIVGFLCRRQGQEIYQKDIERHFCIRGSTASRLLKQLEEDGLIQRRTSQRDARLKQVTPTPKAQALNQQVLDHIAQLEATLSQGLTQEEICQFLATLDKLKQNLL